jgi:hypothetical protein
MSDPWNIQFLSSLCAFLGDHQERGVLDVERIEMAGDILVTVLQVPTRRGGRFGRVVDLAQLRSQFVPDRPSGVADAWFLTIYPPHDWVEQDVIDGICWHAGISA